MIDELNDAVAQYQSKWKTLVAARQNKEFFEALKPVAVGWKTTDRAEYDRICTELHDQSSQLIETWMNGRWVAKFLLRDTQLTGGIEIVKIMQRRPNSTDSVGLDHLDFYGVTDAESILKNETDLQWTREKNDIIDGYDWLSIWFDGTEAKLKTDTVLDIIIAELTESNQKIIGKSA